MTQLDSYLQTQVDGAFLLEEKIGEGGMGCVYAARHLVTGLAVAIKILRVEEARDSQSAVERFRREAEVLQSLRHPNIVSYVASGLTPRRDPYLAMERLSGEPLLAKMKGGSLSVSASLEIARQVCEALSYTHANGVLHRDIKPANIFICEGSPLRVKLIDFGIARFADRRHRLTRSGNIVGTPAYMAPEQIRGDKQSDDRADLYSLGATLYEMLSGQMPLEAPETLSLLLKILESPPRPLQELVNVSGGVAALVGRALAKEPEERFQGAAEMAKVIRGLQAGASHTPTMSRAYPSPPRATLELTSLPEERVEAAMRVNEVTTGELRRVIVVVAMGAEEHAAALSETEARMGAAGGLVEHLYDGRVVGLFGASYSHGDESRRAIVSALEGCDAGLRVGVASGRVLSSGTLFSDAAIPEAAMLAARASAGDLLLSQETFAATRGLFDVAPAGGGAWRVLGERPDGFLIGTRGLRGVETPTVGRETELGALRSLIAGLPALESPRAVLILGDAGMGKSRIKFELRVLLEESQQSCYVVEGTGDPVRAQSPYFLFRAAIRNLCGTKPGDTNFSQRHKLATLLRSLSLSNVMELELLIGVALELLPEEHLPLVFRQHPKRLKSRTEEAFVSLFAALCQRAPVVFILEDLHWSDSATISVVERMMGEGALRLLLVGLGRPSVREQHPEFLRLASCIVLRPLGKSAIRSLVEVFLQRGPSEELLDYLLDATGGNPFLIESLLLQLIQQGFLMPSAEGGFVVSRSLATLEIPEGAEALLQARLDSLPNEEKEVAKKAAVFGKVFWDEGLTALKVQGVERILERLRVKEFVVRRPNSRFGQSKEYVFRHALLQEVAYRLLPLQERKVLHARAASWLVQAGEKDTFTLARHYEIASEKERAAQLYALAARRASQEYAIDSALQALQRAKHLTSDHGLRFEMLLLEESLYFWGGQREEERQLLEALVELAARLGDKERLQVMQREGRYAEMTGEYARSEERCRAAITLAQTLGDTEQELAALITLCGTLAHTGRYAEVQTSAERGIGLAKLMRRPELECGLQLRLQLCNARRGFLGPAFSYAEAALYSARAAQERHLEATSLAGLGSLCVTLGRYPEAEAHLRAALALSEQIRNSMVLAYARMNLGRLFAMTGRFEEGLASLEEASTLAQRIEHPGLPDGIRRYYAQLYLLRNATGDASLAYQEASRVLSAVQRKRSSATEKQLAALACSLRALSLLRLRRAPEALSDLNAAQQLRQEVGALEEGEEELLYHRVLVLQALGQEAQAAEALTEAHDFVERRAAQVERADAYRSAYAPRLILALYATSQGDFSPTMKE